MVNQSVCCTVADFRH